ALQTLRPDDRAGLCVGATDDARVGDGVHESLMHNRRTVAEANLERLPQHFALGVRVLAGAKRSEFRRRREQDTIAPGEAGVGAQAQFRRALPFLTGGDIVRVAALAALQNDLRLAAVLNDERADPVDAARPRDAPAVFAGHLVDAGGK